MALIYTPPGELGSLRPELDAKLINRDSFELVNGRPTLVMFICNHCPYVQAIEDRLIQLGHDFADKVNVVALCSNDPSDYEEDSFENLKKRSLEKSYPFVYLHDESQAVAKSFGAVCTPDFFLYDKSDKLVYRGRLDDSWKAPDKVEKRELHEAIQQTINGQALAENQVPSMGCSIKWRDS